MMKKLLSVMITIVMLFTTVSPCFAASIAQEDIDNALMERGYPASVLEHLDPEQKIRHLSRS